jgi:hypothetical protein
MRALPLLIAGLIFLCFSQQSATAQSAQPQTEGNLRRRLLEWDLNKSFSPKKNSFSRDSTFGSKTITAPTISTKLFGSKSALESASFYTPEFLTPPGKTQLSNSAAIQRFSKSGATTVESALGNKTFTPGKDAVAPNSANLSNTNATNSSKEFYGRNRIYAGAEAERMKRPYTPDNGPKGGVSMGRQLTVDDVREILNKSK